MAPAKRSEGLIVTDTPVPAPVNPLILVQMAVDKGADPGTISKLMDLADRWKNAEARRQFQQAMQRFKADPPEIFKNRTVSFENRDGKVTSYRHATLDNVVDAITKKLSDVGIYHRWETQQANGLISVTCILNGFEHEERVTLSAPADASGGKNAIQQIGSTVSYLERYTLLSATGLTTGDQDDDGGSAGPPAATVDRGELAEKIEFIQNCRSTEELHKFYKEAYKWAAHAKDSEAMRAIIAAKDQRKRELAA